MAEFFKNIGATTAISGVVLWFLIYIVKRTLDTDFTIDAIRNVFTKHPTGFGSDTLVLLLVMSGAITTGIILENNGWRILSDSGLLPVESEIRREIFYETRHTAAPPFFSSYMQLRDVFFQSQAKADKPFKENLDDQFKLFLDGKFDKLKQLDDTKKTSLASGMPC